MTLIMGPFFWSILFVSFSIMIEMMIMSVYMMNSKSVYFVKF
uniref:ATP synthase F0 subunit 8 n=1 Tax=Septifer bilocularis TaxID=102393 RepID=A0A516EZM2_9BIVA|nr:ATP synthase F0 subunit 8 [Septifer bilocularis]QDO71951.1 ATP synthase F0 subunit 8 [Septifer bilocularis]